MKEILHKTIIAIFIGIFLTGCSTVDEKEEGGDGSQTLISKEGIDYSDFSTPSPEDILGAWEYVSTREYQVESINGIVTNRYDSTSSSQRGDLISRFNPTSFVVDGMVYPYSLRESEMIFDIYPVVDSIANGSKAVERYFLYAEADTLLWVYMYEEVEVWGADTMEVVAYEVIRLVRKEETGVPDYGAMVVPALGDLVGDWGFVSRYSFEAIYGSLGEFIYMDDTLYDDKYEDSPISFTDTSVTIEGLEFEAVLTGSELAFYLYPEKKSNPATGISEYYGYNCYMKGDTLVFVEIAKEFITATGVIINDYSGDERRYIRR